MKEERDKRETYFGDAVYDAWRRGYDSDRVTRESCDDHYYAGNPPESVADELARADRRKQLEPMNYDEPAPAPGEGVQCDYCTNDAAGYDADNNAFVCAACWQRNGITTHVEQR